MFIFLKEKLLDIIVCFLRILHSLYGYILWKILMEKQIIFYINYFDYIIN